LVIYKGTLKQTLVGGGQSRPLSFGFYLIVDHDTANIAQIDYITVGTSKIFSTDTLTNLHFVEVDGSSGKTYTEFAQILTDCETNEGYTSEGVFVQGLNSVFAISTNSAITFPKTLSGSGGGVSFQNKFPVYFTSALTVSFDATDSTLSSTHGETLDAALSRLSNMLTAQGYSQQSLKSGDAKGSVPILMPFR